LDAEGGQLEPGDPAVELGGDRVHAWADASARSTGIRVAAKSTLRRPAAARAGSASSDGGMVVGGIAILLSSVVVRAQPARRSSRSALRCS
jgi:hypothetical protein